MRQESAPCSEHVLRLIEGIKSVDQPHDARAICNKANVLRQTRAKHPEQIPRSFEGLRDHEFKPRRRKGRCTLPQIRTVYSLARRLNSRGAFTRFSVRRLQVNSIFRCQASTSTSELVIRQHWKSQIVLIQESSDIHWRSRLFKKALFFAFLSCFFHLPSLNFAKLEHTQSITKATTSTTESALVSRQHRQRNQHYDTQAFPPKAHRPTSI